MATFTSKPATIPSSAPAISEKFSDLSAIKQYLDKLPEAERQKLGDVEFTPDTIVIKTAQVGAITLKVTERNDSRIVLSAVSSPIPIDLAVNLKPLAAESTELTTSMEVNIPPFLKPMVGGTLQKAVDQFGDLVKRFV